MEQSSTNKAQADQRCYDVIVFGATGFVGQILCRYLIDHLATQDSVTWALAGRSQQKLEQLKSELGPQAEHLPIVTADVTNASSLQNLCAQTRVVISTVGPYALYGEPLVKTCVETGTDYCDLTGEFQWIRRMIKTYATAAKESGARIVHCCGFDSVPSDLGVYYLQQQAQQRFGQPCQRVKMRVKAALGGVSGGTISSGINIVKEAMTNPELQANRLNPYSLCEGFSYPDRQQSTLIPVQYDNDFQCWATSFVMAEVNARIVFRSNALLEDAYGRDFDYDEGVLTAKGIPGWTVAQGLDLGLKGFGLAAALPPTRWALESWIVPSPGEGPSPEQQAQGFYDLRFLGKTASGDTVQVKVTGDRDPGYGSTAKILGQAGLCLAHDIPTAVEGGFWTPAALFKDALIKRLTAHAGLTFEHLEPGSSD
ncbi:MAG: saccharopine dehydrogenase NADP-binding domain-containing protein [Cyanobacteria bacterium P01_F01_bin.150]